MFVWLKMKLGFMLAFYLLFMTLLLLRSASSSSSSSPLKNPYLGIPPLDEKYYKSSDLIKCKDGYKKFTKAQLNDDFCDCPDGTDEPGTSACPGGKFFCRNAGHAPLILFSSRVNDGICDCCDGSDEYDGKVKCPNICWEVGKVARDKLKKKIATYQEGVTLRRQEVEQVKVAQMKDEAELSKLKKEESVLKEILKQLKDRKEKIEKEEEKERLRKEKEDKQKNNAEKEANEEKAKVDEKDTGHRIEDTKPSDGEDNAVGSNHDKIGTLDYSPEDKDAPDESKSADVLDNNDAATDSPGSEGSLLNGVDWNAKEDEEEPGVRSETDLKAGKDSTDEVINTGNDNIEGLSKEELGRLVASRWTGENPGSQQAESDAGQDNGVEDHKHLSDEEYESYASETDDDSHKYDDEDIENDTGDDFGEEEHDDLGPSYKSDTDTVPDMPDDITANNPSWLVKIQATARNILNALNLFQTPINLSDAARIRKEYEESSTKLSKIQSRISSLTQKLKHDFGPEKEFYSFYDRCFESKQNKYTYKVCPYKQASQEEGYSRTNLGRWEKFEDSHKVMVFSNGDRCWNGPDRSLKVRLKCGLKNEISDVDEPSRCEYVALLSTPALCKEEKLKELQHKLELMNKEQPQSHDEL